MEKDIPYTTVGFNDPTPQGAAHRGEQAEIDADIEGLADDPGARALMDKLRADGAPIEERLEKLTIYLKDLEAERALQAAE